MDATSRAANATFRVNLFIMLRVLCGAIIAMQVKNCVRLGELFNIIYLGGVTVV